MLEKLGFSEGLVANPSPRIFMFLSWIKRRNNRVDHTKELGLG